MYLSIDRRFTGKLWATMAPPPPLPGTPTTDPFKEDLLKILLAKALTPAPAPQALDAKTVLEIASLFRDNNGSRNITEEVALLMQTATTLAGAMNPPEGLGAVAAQFLPVVDRLIPSGARASSRCYAHAQRDATASESRRRHRRRRRRARVGVNGTGCRNDCAEVVAAVPVVGADARSSCR
jgi:hypothetical protein